MRNKVLWALMLLNGILAVSLMMRVGRENVASAQVGAGPAGANQRIRVSDVTMIPGEVSGGSSAVIYLIGNVNNQKHLSAMAFDGQTIAFMAPVDLERLFEGGNTGGTGTGTGPGVHARPGR
jgi:hypothetical protein